MSRYASDPTSSSEVEGSCGITNIRASMIIIEKYGPMRTWKVVELDLLERILGRSIEKSMAALAET